LETGTVIVCPLAKRGAKTSCLRDRSVLEESKMLIRTEQPMDFPKIRGLNRAAFDTATEADIVEALRSDAENVLSLVAEEGGEIVGHIMFSPVQLTGAADVRAMALAPMAVHPTRQRAGIGSALVRAGLEECQRLGIDAVFVVGHPLYYPRFGFEPASRLGFVCEFDVPDEAFMVAQLVADILDGKTATVYFHPVFNGG
jgi:putative acetyltransferase